MRYLTLNLSKKEAMNKVIKASQKLDLALKNRSENTISLKSPGGILSFGNDITIKFSNDGSKTKLSIMSESSSPIQVIDWNTNHDLELELKDVILSLSGK